MPNSDAEDIDLDKVSPATLKAYVKSTLEAPGRRWSPQLEQLRKEGMKPEPMPIWQRNNLIAEIVLGYFNRNSPSGKYPTLFDAWSIDERDQLNKLCHTPTHGGIVPAKEWTEDRDKLLRIRQRLNNVTLGLSGYYSLNQYYKMATKALADIYEIVVDEPFGPKPPSQELTQFDQVTAWENTAYRILHEELKVTYQGLSPETLLEKVREWIRLNKPTKGYAVLQADLDSERRLRAEWAQTAFAIFKEMGVNDPVLQPHALRLKVLEVFKSQKFDLQQWSEAAKSVAKFLRIEPGDDFGPNHLRIWLTEYFNQPRSEEILGKLQQAEAELINWRSFALTILKEMDLTSMVDGVLKPLNLINLVGPWIQDAKTHLNAIRTISEKAARLTGITK